MLGSLGDGGGQAGGLGHGRGHGLRLSPQGGNPRQASGFLCCVEAALYAMLHIVR